MRCGEVSGGKKRSCLSSRPASWLKSLTTTTPLFCTISTWEGRIERHMELSVELSANQHWKHKRRAQDSRDFVRVFLVW